MRRLLESRLARVLLAGALALGVYALLGFAVAPRVLRTQIIEAVHERLGLDAAVGEVRINPFTLQATIDHFNLPGEHGESLIAFDRLFIDFELASLWNRAFTFKQIALDAPRVDAVVAKDGAINLARLVPKPTQPESKAPAGVPALRIEALDIRGGTVGYADHSHPTEFELRLQPIDLSLRDFSTGAEGGAFTLSAATALGERFSWRGHVALQPFASDGEISIEGLRARTAWEYFEDRLNFVVASGRLDLSARYRATLAGTLDLHVEAPRVALSDLTLRPRGADQDWVKFAALTASGTTLDLSQHRVRVDSLTLDRPGVLAWLDPDGKLNLASLAAGRGAAAAESPRPSSAAAATPPATPRVSVPAAPASGAAAPAAPWSVELATFALRGGKLEFTDRSLHPAAELSIAPLDLTVKGVSLDLSKPLDVAFTARVNGEGSVGASGTLTPQPLAAAVKIEAKRLDLSALQPYLGRYTGMTLREGSLGANATVRVGSAGGAPRVEVGGNVSVDRLHTVDDELHEDFVNWQRLDVRGIAFSHNPDRLDVAEVILRKPYARVIVEADGSLNVKRVLTAPGAAPASTVAPTPIAAAAPVGEPAKAAGSAGGKAGAGGPAAAGGASRASGAGMPVSIRKITVHQGVANFSDLSVEPNFSASIEALEGGVAGLSSDPKARAKVDLHGQVGEFSPVAIAGEVNLLSAALYTDLALSFRNIELSIFNPYSGKFAGYDISKGKLTTELHYHVEGRKLDARHHVVIDQLEFGAKTASKDAVSLPVKLAVALLKDRHGVIDLELPVAGTLDDPSFRLGPVIWHVVLNLLTKAVTAPFALLGSLFGGGPDLQFVAFAPGSAALDDAAAAKIKTLAKALDARPQLKLDVPIGYVTDLDRDALLDAALAAHIEAARSDVSAGAKGVPASAATAFGTLDPAARLAVLTRLYTQELGAVPTYPEAVTGAHAPAEVLAAKLDFLTQAIRAHLAIDEPALRALGERRAAAVQGALIAEGGLDPSRIFLVANGKATAQDGMVRLELTLK